jgi:hypothetical protein
VTDKAPKRFTYRICSACHKRGYPTRKAARAAARAANRGHMQAYECPAMVEGAQPLWHVGHLPAKVLRGRWDKDEWLERRKR